MYPVLIVGAGSIGERHLRCFLETGRAELSLCDNRPHRLTEIAGKYRVSETFPAFDAINLSKFDAAVICVPAHQHVPFARRAVDAGLHVLIEKPLSVTLDGIDELDRAARERRLVVGVAFIRRSMRLCQALRNELAGRQVGEVLSVSCFVGYDHRMARPDYRETYFARKDTGGGAIHDILAHFINLFHWFFGPVDRVVSSYDHLEIDGMEGEDTASVLLRFRESNVMSNLHAVLWQAHTAVTMTFAAQKGSIIGDWTAGRMGVFLRETGEWNWMEGLVGERDSKGQNDEPFIFQANNFLDAIEGKADVLCTLAEGRHTVEVCLAALESGRRQCAVTV